MLRQLIAVALLLVVSPFEGRAAVHRLPLSRWRCSEAGFNSSLCEFLRRAKGDSPYSIWDPVRQARDLSPVEMLGGEAVLEVKAPLQNNFNLVYTVVADLGTPPVPVRLIVDTGSSDLWVKASSMFAPFGGGTVYDASRSASAKTRPGRQVTILYGQGRVEGDEVRDQVCLGRLCIANQSFIFADTVYGIPDLWLFDGILGLGYPVLALDRYGATFVERVNATFQHLAIGFSLGGINLADGGGYLAIGELKELQREAQRDGFGSGITLQLWGINNQAMYWLVRTSIAVVPQLKSGALRTNAMKVEIAAAEGRGAAMAILDSGTSLIAAPGLAYLSLVQALMADRPDAKQKCTTTLASAFGQLMCLCDAELNSLTFTMAGMGGQHLQVTLEARDLMQLVGVGAMGQGVCRIAVMPAPPGMPLWILGDIFLRHLYAVHDVLAHKVHLYPQRGSHAAVILDEEELNRTQDSDIAAAAAFAFNVACAIATALAIMVICYTLRPRRGPAESDAYDRF